MTAGSIVERIWAYDASLWTDSGEDRWLGWLDVVPRVRAHVDELNAFAEAATEQFHDCVLLGMGGSSLAPEVLRRTFAVESFHVLDTTHPEAIRRLERTVDLERTLFLASSKSGSTIETRSHLEYFWERTAVAARSSPRSPTPAPSSTGSRTSAASGRSSRASPRSAAATRLSRCSGSCRRR